MIELYSLTVENEKMLLAAPCENIRYGWKIHSDESDVFQESYQLKISHRGKCVFDSGEVISSQTFGVVPKIKYLHGADYTFTVKVVTNVGEAESSMDFSTGIENDDFTAKWIRPKRHIEGASVYFRKEFKVVKPVRRAMAYAVGLGYGNLFLNGKRVEDYFLEVPITNYKIEVLYRTYDITNLIEKENCIGIHVGEGFYSQSRVWHNKWFKDGDICALAEIRIEYHDGTYDIIATDSTWQTAYSPCILSNVHGGEIYDARQEIEGWCNFGCDEELFTKAVLDTIPKGKLKGAMMPPVRKIRSVKPIGVKQLQGADSGLWVFDMGENFAGVVKIRFPKSAEGSTYILRFAETVDSSGHIDSRSIGVYHVYCLQQQIYICSGKDNEEWTPEFSYHSFRYVELTGLYGREPSPHIIEGVALSTDFETIGNVYTDNEDLNRLHEIMMRTFRSNYHGIPEDCPAREKCGWLGDAQIVSDTALYNYDVLSSYEKYMQDIRTSREAHGSWTMIAPGRRECGFATTLWGCPQIIIPYNMYMYRGDRWVLEEYYNDMKEWVAHELKRSNGYIISEGLGDWCPPVGEKSKKRIPLPHSSTLMFYEETKKLGEIASVLGLNDDAREYYALAEEIKKAFNKAFYNSELHTYGYYASNAAAIITGIYPGGHKNEIARATKDLIEANNYEMTTGIYGNKYLIPMLCENGMGDVAMKVLFGRDHISFGTMMDDGATSLWECLEMKQVDEPELVSSYNHPMHSGFAYFYYAHLAGIKPRSAGFEAFEISPCFVDGVNYVKAETDTPYGKIVSEISYSNSGNEISITVPPCTECTLKIGKIKNNLASGKHNFTF